LPFPQASHRPSDAKASLIVSTAGNRRTSLPVAVSQICPVFELELAGLVRQLPGKSYIRVWVD
jgi:hypothetical protein